MKGGAQPDLAQEGATIEGRLERLASAIEEVQAGERISPRTIKLLKSGTAKMAQKVIEEAAELGIEAVRGNRQNLINESVDLFYNLVVLWRDAGIEPAEIWSQMDRRELLLGMEEKMPKSSDEG
jgi:phosphoribosyl-ATP pyrophosphohydrolase